MRWKRALVLCVLLAAVLSVLGLPFAVLAQDYSFTVDQQYVEVWVNYDGSVRLEYWFTFTSDVGNYHIAAVDVGLPNRNFNVSDITADVSGRSIDHVGTDFEGEGSYGVAVWLGAQTIQSGETDTVHVIVPQVGDMVYEDDDDPEYASIEFSPTWFNSSYAHGTTSLTVRFHLPPGVQPEEPRWHSSPSGWPQDQPETSLDSEGRVVYAWHNPSAQPDRQYMFGASFPRSYVAEGVVQAPPSGIARGFGSILAIVGGIGALLCNPFTIVIAIIAGITGLSKWGQNQRKMRYLPPLLKVEGVGIKRGLTAVEAAILLETPLNKVLTMMLFGLLKKGAVTVLDENPLKVEANDPLPEDLHAYETGFLESIKKDKTLSEAKLRKVMVELVKSVNSKMKGFSRRESTAYYRDVIQRAWQQVEGAATPEVRGQLFDERLEWAMLDGDFDERTERTFARGPVYIPTWWGYYRPWGRTVSTTAGKVGKAAAGTRSTSSGRSSSVQLPTLPGGSFAASIVRGVQNTSGRIVSSVTGFTGKVTQVTNPPPKTSSSGRSYRGSSGGGGCACACACACAGCACACAGGGR
jgi:hypothetical protein